MNGSSQDKWASVATNLSRTLAQLREEQATTEVSLIETRAHAAQGQHERQWQYDRASDVQTAHIRVELVHLKAHIASVERALDLITLYLTHDVAYSVSLDPSPIR